MVTLPIKGRAVMVGDRTVEGARQILIGNYRFTKVGGAWQEIAEEDWQKNVPSIEISATSILGIDGEEWDQSVPYGTELDELLGERKVEITDEQRELIDLTNMLNTVPPRKLEGLSAEELVYTANQMRDEYNEANGVFVPDDSEEQDEE